jgi:hypothetical protein
MLIFGQRTEPTFPAVDPRDRCACGHLRHAHYVDAAPSFRPRLGACDPGRETAPHVDTDAPCRCMRFRPIRS